MKRLLIGDRRERLLSTLEVILRNWGYRALVTSNRAELRSLIEEGSPGLLIIGASFLEETSTPLGQAVENCVTLGQCPLIVMGEAGFDIPISLPHEYLDFPPDVFALFSIIQRHLNKHPRHNLRVSLHLPAMVCFGKNCQWSEVLSLSRRGLFVKTGFRLNKGDMVKIVLPLLGMKKELEVEGQVLYRIEPDPENNYLQGMGIEFSRAPDENSRALEAFIEKTFFGELAARENLFPELAHDQLRFGPIISPPRP